MYTLSSQGSFKNTESFLKSMAKADFFSGLEGLAQRGVDALASATPKDSGLAASSWGYEIERTREHLAIYWTNTNVEGNGYVVVIGIQYGHGTGTGGFVAGRDFINPAIKPIFDQIEAQVWKVVTSA